MKIFHKRAEKSYVNAAGPRNKEGLEEYESVKMSSANSMQKDERFIMQSTRGWFLINSSLSLNVVLFYPESFDLLLISF